MIMIETFITVMAWFGLVLGGISTFACWHTWNELNHTAHGQLRQALANAEGKTLVANSPVRSILVFIVSLAWLITTWVS